MPNTRLESSEYVNLDEYQTTGGCLCGAVRYASPDLPERVHFCHCGMCKRMSGGPFSYFAGFKKNRLIFLKGEPTYYQSSQTGRRGHCARCGSHLLFEALLPESEYIYVTGGTLDHPERAPVTKHVGTDRWLPWLHIGDPQSPQ